MVTQEGTNCKIYVDGILINSLTKESINTVFGGKFIGSYSDTQRYWNGKISNVKIYNRALSPEEILQNYNAMFYQWTNTLQNRVKSDGGYYEDTTNYTTEIIKEI